MPYIDLTWEKILQNTLTYLLQVQLGIYGQNDIHYLWKGQFHIFIKANIKLDSGEEINDNYGANYASMPLQVILKLLSYIK